MMKHRPKMLKIIKEECDKFGIDVEDLKNVHGGKISKRTAGNIHSNIKIRSISFLSAEQQAELIGVDVSTINSRIHVFYNY